MNENINTIKDKETIKTRFHRLFEHSHIIYTILFFLIIIVITVLSLYPKEDIGNIVLIVTISFTLTYLILMFISMIPQMEAQIFSKERKHTIKKLTILMITFGICLILILIYFFFGSSSQIPVQFLGWDIILPYSCVIIYFGWNLIQIFFIRKIMVSISNKANDILITRNRESNISRIYSYVFLTIGLILPIVFQLSTYFGLLNYFEIQSPGDSLEPIYWFNGWNIAMYIIIIITSYKVINLFIKSIKNETPNVFSSLFYIFIWLYLWYRSFSFIWSFRRVTEIHGFDFFRVVIDILLMILTAILVLKGLGGKLFRFKIFTPNNLSFFLFAFTILYFEGQIIMIIGAGSISGTYASQSQISLVNNFLIILITVIFYWWYSEFILERNNFIFKENFKQEEVISLIKDFKKYLESTGALEADKISDFEFQNFLKSRKLKLKNMKK
ncbi:MAG: hypothetical protein ACFFBT_14320 [Promethearchaeota archaeon]